MKKISSKKTLFIFALVLTSIGFGCNKKDEAKTPDNRSGVNLSANYKVNSSNEAANSSGTGSNSSNSTSGNSAH